MKLFAAIVCLLAIANAYPNTFAADSCKPDICLAANGCVCSNTTSPLSIEETPQFVTLAFNDAVTDFIYNNQLAPLLVGRTNADNNQIGATFYVPHEYTDYERVNNLYNAGLEIAVHSISKSPLISYWQQANESVLYDEFNGQRRLIANFANIPIEDIIGARTPNFEINGDTTFGAYVTSGIQYDNSWTALSKDLYFPYTLDYASTQPCQIGVCPTGSFPGMWVLPIIDQVGTDGIQCNSLSGCTIAAESADDVKNWLLQQFNHHYQSKRTPMTLNVNSAFFALNEYNYDGFVAFLDVLKTYTDVFLVTHKEVRDWMANPVPLGQYSRQSPDRAASCTPGVCELLKGQEYRYMKTCTGCPEVYPWVGNPLGETDPEVP